MKNHVKGVLKAAVQSRPGRSVFIANNSAELHGDSSPSSGWAEDRIELYRSSRKYMQAEVGQEWRGHSLQAIAHAANSVGHVVRQLYPWRLHRNDMK